jgi:hypothetical protein
MFFFRSLVNPHDVSHPTIADIHFTSSGGSMVEDQPENSDPETRERQSVGISFVSFLEAMPPDDEYTLVKNALEKDVSATRNFVIATPAIKLHCSSDICNGTRVYRYDDGDRHLSRNEPTLTYLTYRCSNCRRMTKMFSLAVVTNKADPPAALCAKFGEIPKFGSPTPSRLLRLFGSDSKIFLKGRQCENHGLGVGAFSYYRRVVENHKDQLFDEVIKAALKIAPDTVDGLRQAKAENQFLKALEAVKDIIPQGLLIDGHNPFTLLHSALSDGLHARTDEECLQSAHDVRMVLAELVERIGQLLKEETELAAAVGRLTRSRPQA